MAEASRVDLLSAAAAAPGVHVDLGPWLGTRGPVLVSADDLAGALGALPCPTVSLEIGDAAVHVRPADGGVAFSLEVRW